MLRDLPKQHVTHTLRPYFGYPKNGVKETKLHFLPITDMPYISTNGSNGHKKEHGKFEKVKDKFVQWGTFNRQVYRATHPLMDGLDVLLKKGQKFIVAWPGNIAAGEFRPLSLWKGLAKNNNYTHYQIIADVVLSNRTIPIVNEKHPEWAVSQKYNSVSYELLFVRRELIDHQLPVSKN
ncbi:MAG: hypothetical protein WCT52_00055 [Candidatus Micrarchaeia archaeon]